MLHRYHRHGDRSWKYGPTPGDPTTHWYELPGTIVGDVVTFSITDGELGDSDLIADGTIMDPGGPGVMAMPVEIIPIPVLMPWGMVVLVMLLVLLTLWHLCQKSVPARRRARRRT